MQHLFLCQLESELVRDLPRNNAPCMLRILTVIDSY
jgi:hypothetical protein